MPRRRVQQIIPLSIHRQRSEAAQQRRHARQAAGGRSAGGRPPHAVHRARQVGERGGGLHGRGRRAEGLLAVHTQAAWGQGALRDIVL